MRRVLLLLNPASRRGRDALADCPRLLTRAGFEMIAAFHENPARFSDSVREFASRVDLVIAGGGDGTVRSILSALRDTGLPLGVLPLGTANNLARNLGVPLSLPDACRALAEGAARTIDVATVNGEPFLNVAGLGLSTEINRGVPGSLKRRFGVFGYALYAFKVLRRTRPFHAEIETHDQVAAVRALQITTCNGRHFGAGMTIHPEAKINDARLDLCAFELSYWWQGLLLLPAMWAGRQHEFRRVRFLHGQDLTIRTRRKLWIDADGEVLTTTPARFGVFPNALRVIAPKA